MEMNEAMQRRVQQIHADLATGVAGKINFVLTQSLKLTSATVREAFLLSFEAGARQSPAVLKMFVQQPYAKDLPARWYRDTFEDDTNFCPERFYITVSAKDLEDQAWQHAAIAQGLRMLAAGSIDAEYLRPLRELPVAHAADSSVDAVLLAHSPDQREELRVMSHHLDTIGLSNVSPAVQGRFGNGYARLAAARVARERLFAERWLAPQLPANEAAAVKNVHPAMLRTLYAAQWELGYDGYRAAVQGVSA